MSKVYSLVGVFILSILMVACIPAEEKAEDYYELGREKAYQNDIKGAQIEFEKGLEYMPKHARLLYEIGNCYMNYRDYHTAIEKYTLAIESDANYADAYYNRGLCWFYLSDREKSCYDWKKADALGRPSLQDKIKHCK